MAKKRRRRRTSLITKAINAGVLLLAFSHPLKVLLAGGDVAGNLAFAATGGADRGRFSIDNALPLYGPMIAAIILKKAISMVRRHARI